MIQDNKLNYWFATNEGIYSFDYYNYKKIECDKAKSSSVFNFVKNKEGIIFCHNLNNQIFQIKNGECNLFYELVNDEMSSDISLSITNEGYLLVGSRTIVVLDAKANVKLRYPVKYHYLGPPFRLASGGIQFHLSAGDSVLIYSHGKISGKKLAVPEGQLRGGSVLKMFNIKEHTFSFDLKHQTLFKFDQSNFKLTELPKHLSIEKEGSIRIYETGSEAWTAGTLPGVSFLSVDNEKISEKSFYNDYFISDVYQDHEGNFLLSTFDRGVLVIPDLKIPDVIHSFKDDLVTGLYADSTLGLILGCSKGKLMAYKQSKFELIDDKGMRPIEAVYGDEKSDLILFDNGLIKVYNKHSGETFEIPGHSLKDAVFINEHEFYVGTNRAVLRIKWDGKKNFDVELVKDLGYRTYSLSYDHLHELLYISNAKGLFVLSKPGLIERITFKNEDIFPNDIFYHEGKIYLSSRKNGILVIEKNKVVSVIEPKVDAKTDVVEKMVIYKGTILGNSSNGLFQFDMKGNVMKSIHSLFGFSSARVIDFVTQGEDIWVSHSKGVQKIDLGYSELTIHHPVIRFDKLIVNDQPVEFSGNATFETRRRKFQFIFTSPTLRNTETVRYHYRLIGYDPRWSINKYADNQITYNALAPGTYTLEVKAESLGAFSKVMAYSFSIASPFYTRSWFIVLAVILFLGVVYSIYKWQLMLQRRKSERINELNTSKLTAIQSQMNPHFIFNSLNSIQDLILKGDVEHSYSYITTFSNLVRKTLNYSEKDFVDFDQEIKLLELYLSLEKLRFKRDFLYDIKMDGIEDIMVPPLLIQPFIENALVHGLLHKEGQKKLNIKFELGDVLVCTIEDNGVGREKAKMIKLRQKPEHESFSGRAIKKRFEILSNIYNGNFAYTYEDLYEGKEASGTKVTLTIPVKRKF